ncbi:MAG TPA: hypothetical protein VFQ91_12350 [Bryobacteraceae bacterium]|nr:hypothetical protein [Bryobacteraceae bacterium]
MTDAEIFSRFLAFLKATGSEHELGGPATASELSLLPPALRPLYREHNGAALFDGDLLFFLAGGPPDEDGTVQHASRLAREADWPIPQEVTLFGRDTGGEVLGVWTGPRDASKYPSPVILTGLLFEPAAHSLLATSLERYLLTTTVWHCLDTDYAETAFRLFQVPKALQAADLEEMDGEAWFAWADPALPALPGDPYEEPLTGSQIRALLEK